ncbi:MAG: ATP-binding protein [Deltaproteobacteria bacterium]|nr:ATP-binding protein [Deltaproteobacteria bacterium]
MTPALQQNSISEGKRFRLVKYFALASFIVLIIFSFPFSVFIAQKAKDILTKSYENYALLLGENISRQVYEYFYKPTLNKYGRIKLSEKEQQKLMDRVIKNTTHGFNAELVNVYDHKQGLIAYSTDPGLIGKKANKTFGYQKAVDGEDSSGMITGMDDFYYLDMEGKGGEKKLRTYIPFKLLLHSEGKEAEEVVISVFELIQDMTEEYKSIARFQYTIFGLSILIMTLIFLALLLIVHKAERLIEQRAREQRELEEQLHLAERLAALGEMVAGVSHEIKNPLGIIRSTAELLGGMPDADETQKRLSGVITEESSRLNEIVTEFLDFARPQEPNLQECYLEEILQKNISFLGPELENQGIIVNDNLNGRSLKLQADQELLYRALLNIFINSMQSMNNAGSINVKVEEDKGYYLIKIEDTGSGISQENMKKIFNPFFTTKEKGSGLGLSIVKKIIEGHKGSIGIESIEDTGTMVSIQLPQKT